ncbi:MAG: hypothetical protein Q8N95_10050 [Desulfobacterales bacterium]|nr:hypothetical protein [Desulfobacterales bacterium]
MKDLNVVLDKSYLRGAGRKKVSALCESHNVLMPESLFFELLTTKEDKDRAICFGNLPNTANPVILVQGISSMFSFEIGKKLPIKDVKDMCIDVPYIFNKHLKHLDFKYTCEQRQTLLEWQKDVASRIEGFKEKSACVSGWFPGLKGYKPGMDPKHINEAKLLICEDLSVVREIYKTIRPSTFPEAEILTEEWALFRYLQVHVFAALEYVRLFGDGNSTAISGKIENEILDLDYCVTALLVGALASHDMSLIEKFKRIRPTGIVIGPNLMQTTHYTHG